MPRVPKIRLQGIFFCCWGISKLSDFVLPGETYDPTATDPRKDPVSLQLEGRYCDAVIVSIDKTAWARLLQEDLDMRNAGNGSAISRQRGPSVPNVCSGLGIASARDPDRLCPDRVVHPACLEMARNVTAHSHVPINQQQLGDFTGMSSVHVLPDIAGV